MTEHTNNMEDPTTTEPHSFTFSNNERDIPAEVKGIGINNFGILEVKVKIENSKWHTGELQTIKPSNGVNGHDGMYRIELNERANIKAKIGDVTYVGATKITIPEEVGDELASAYNRKSMASRRDEVAKESVLTQARFLAESDDEFHDELQNLVANLD